MGAKYSDEELTVIRTAAPVCDSFEELSAVLLQRLGVTRTPIALYQVCRVSGILIRGYESTHPRKIPKRLTRAELAARIEYLRGVCADTRDWREVTLAYNAKYGTEKGVDYVRRMCHRAGVKIKAPDTPPRGGALCMRQLCETCVHSVPNYSRTRGCNWSRRFKPVPGWETVKGGPDFYIVKCPEYEKE